MSMMRMMLFRPVLAPSMGGVSGRWYTDRNLSHERKNKLMYRSLNRGTRENGVLLSAYARTKMETMSAEELDLYEDLLNEQDPELFKWISGKLPIPEDKTNPLLVEVKDFVEKGEHLKVGK